MNILVCISRVPDTATKITIGSDSKSIDNKSVKYVLNPYDENAIEEGLRVKEKHGGTVTAITVGSADSTDILRTALAMGADTAVLIKGDNLDSYQVASNIANYSKSKNYDLIFAGRQSVDFDSLQIPASLATLLDIPSISIVSKVEVEGDSLKAERDIEGGKEILSASLPCVISCQQALNSPRYPKLPDIMKAKKKPIEEVAAIDVASTTTILGMELPSKARVGKILGDSDADINEIVRSLHEDAKII